MFRGFDPARLLLQKSDSYIILVQGAFFLPDPRETKSIFAAPIRKSCHSGKPMAVIDTLLIWDIMRVISG